LRRSFALPPEESMTPARVALLAAIVTLASCDAPPAPFGTEPVPEPKRFAAEMSVPGVSEYGITFGPGGTEAYFTRQGGGRRGRPQIFVSRFAEDAWSRGEPAPFSTGWEESPFLTPDGHRLFFSSRRDVPGWGPVRGNNNLWVVERRDGVWGQPRPLEGEVNKPRVDDEDAPARSESGPVLLASGELLYWTTESAEWASDLYVADQVDGRFVNPRPLLVNTGGAESNPAVSPDGRFLVFQSYRDFTAIGEQDLYLSERTDHGWGRSRLLPEPLNSPSNDGYPSFSPDGRYFFFASDRPNPGATWSIYFVETSALAAAIEAT
jgi:Tol biopolymer transport system component